VFCCEFDDMDHPTSQDSHGNWVPVPIVVPVLFVPVLFVPVLFVPVLFVPVLLVVHCTVTGKAEALFACTGSNVAADTCAALVNTPSCVACTVIERSTDVYAGI
jgi:hypothetical protein